MREGSETINSTGMEGRVTLDTEEHESLDMEFYETVYEAIDVHIEMGVTNSHGSALVREVSATLMLLNNESDVRWNVSVYGVHWPRNGVLLITTTSTRFPGIFGLSLCA